MKFKKFITQLNFKKAQLAVLIDPDKFNPQLIKMAELNSASCFLVGGSKLKSDNFKSTIQKIKKITKLPVIIFPGDEKQLCKEADGIFILSLISGRNPEYLINKHIKAAPYILKYKLPSIPVAYVMIDGGNKSTTSKVTKTNPLKNNQINLIKNTCIAGELLGFKAIYLEAGSGAKNTIKAQTIKKIKKNINIPLIVGGGISSFNSAKQIIKAGANLVVVGNALEKNSNLIIEIGKAFN
ncbi:MAG: phosphoglycerol geranylgeranyltransferase [Sphingobacteriaceae bacterium]|nr:phosphoglycerol geranylgeranyltransferase [Sphingobacteriaceae bacterium]